MGINLGLHNEKTKTSAPATARPHKITALKKTVDQNILDISFQKKFFKMPMQRARTEETVLYTKIYNFQNKYIINILLQNGLRYVWFGKHPTLKL
jgi:hypothetical protein